MNKVSPRARWLSWMLMLAVLAAPALTLAAPTAPTATDRQIARTVAQLLRTDHLLRHPIDDEISARAFKIFLKQLDPWKRYFLQSDYDAFARYEKELDDMLVKGDVSFAYLVFKTFLQRVGERVKTIDELLEEPMDFTKEEDLNTDKDKLSYAKNAEEARELWRRWLKYDILVFKADGTQHKEAVEKLHRRYHSYARRMQQIDGEELLEMYVTAFTNAFDPHTSYMSPQTVDNFDIVMRLRLEGIGAALTSTDGYTVVNKIIPGGAAEKQGGLKIEDRIVGVGQGDNGEMVDTVDMKLSDVVKLIRGKEGTVVRLWVMPPGSAEKKIVRFVRAKIELKDSEAQSEVLEAGRKPDGSAYKIGVIELPSFYMDMEGARRGLPDYKSTTRDVRQILEKFKKDGVEAVVLDLRRNGGGSLTEAINLTGLFIGEGPVVQVKDADGRVQPYYDLDPGITWAGPLVVVTSKFSASASEILAGAIQDYGRGLIVGDHATHGKGTVQSLQDLGQRIFRVPNATQLGSLKITIQQFYRPNGESTQKRGVLADIELPSITTHLDVGESDLDHAMPFDKIDSLNFKKYGYVTPAICSQLRHLSDQRTAQAEKFQQVAKRIARYLEQKSRKTVTLNEDKFLKDRADVNADKEEEKKSEEMLDKGGIQKDYYLDEVLAITADYLGLRHVAKGK